jgi:hypothetical protein
MIKFAECRLPGYGARTKANIRNADLTIAFAVDFTTGGEVLTKNLAGGLYYPVQLMRSDNYLAGLFEMIITDLYGLGTLKLNVAGNGIYTLFEKASFKQSEIDAAIYLFLMLINEEIGISEIHSGGQTGVDEAALKTADKLRIPGFCIAPQNWVFRNKFGKDVYGETMFKSRFGAEYLTTIA